MKAVCLTGAHSKRSVRKLEETSDSRPGVMVDQDSLLVGSPGLPKWMVVVLSGCETFYRRVFYSRCVAGIATSRSYIALLRFWR